MNSHAMWTSVKSRQFPDAHIVTATFSDHRVDVYVPPDVSVFSPVLVLHDGRNVFFPEHSTQGVSWGILDIFASDKKSLTPTPVVISVWGTDSEVAGARYFELAPQNVLAQNDDFWGTLLSRAEIPMAPLRGNEYQALIVEQVLPAVSAFTGIQLQRERTALCGSSMGGLTSLYGATLYPNVYGTVLSLSTHWAFWSEGFIDQVIGNLVAVGMPRIWLDRGDLDLDANYVGLHEHAAQLLIDCGWNSGVAFQARVFEGTGHNEGAWAQRISEVLHWWLAGIPVSA